MGREAVLLGLGCNLVRIFHDDLEHVSVGNSFGLRPDLHPAFSFAGKDGTGEAIGLSHVFFFHPQETEHLGQRLATCRAKPISWVTQIMVIPSSANSIMVSRTSLIISGSSADVGSSKSIIRGCMHKERAIATRCC